MSIIVAYLNYAHLKIVINQIFMDINKWFKTNLLSVYFSKTHYLEFRTKNFNDNINVCYNNRYITNTIQTKFLRVITDNTLSRKYRIDCVM
jgi:hypothetical protein